MTELAFTVYGKPQPAGSKRGFNVGGRVIITDANKNSRPWKALVSDAAQQAMSYPEHDMYDRNGDRPLFRGPLGLEVTFWLPRPKGHYGSGRNADTLRAGAPLYPDVKPDTTKLLRAVEDACTGLVWADDAQVVNQWVRKMYGEPARCEVRVWTFDDV